MTYHKIVRSRGKLSKSAKVDVSYARLNSDGTYLLVEPDKKGIRSVNTIAVTSGPKINQTTISEEDFNIQFSKATENMEIAAYIVDTDLTWQAIFQTVKYIPNTDTRFKEFMIANFFPPRIRDKNLEFKEDHS